MTLRIQRQFSIVQHRSSFRASSRSLPDPKRDGLGMFRHLRERLPDFARTDSWWPRACKNKNFRTAAAGLLYDEKKAAFDVDHTILAHADCAFSEIEAMLHERCLPQGMLNRFRALSIEHGARRMSDLDYFKGLIVMREGAEVRYLQAYANRLWNDGVPHLYGSAPLRHWIDPAMAYLLACGEDRTALVSASPFWIVEPLAELFQMPRGNVLTMDPCVSIAGLVEKNIRRVCYGDGKAEAIRTLWPDGFDFAFGDNPYGDLPLLGEAREAAFGVGEKMLVRSQSRLSEIAKKVGLSWQVRGDDKNLRFLPNFSERCERPDGLISIPTDYQFVGRPQGLVW